MVVSWLSLTYSLGSYMRVFDLADHFWTDIGDDDLSAGRRIGDRLLCAFDDSLLDLMVLDAVLGRCGGRCLCLCRGGTSIGVNCSIPVLLVLIEVFDKLPDGGDGVVARVMATGGLLLRRHVSALVEGSGRVATTTGPECKVQYKGRKLASAWERTGKT
jgi:hypothetical protein